MKIKIKCISCNKKDNLTIGKIYETKTNLSASHYVLKNDNQRIVIIPKEDFEIVDKETLEKYTVTKLQLNSMYGRFGKRNNNTDDLTQKILSSKVNGTDLNDEIKE